MLSKFIKQSDKSSMMVFIRWRKIRREIMDIKVKRLELLKLKSDEKYCKFS